MTAKEPKLLPCACCGAPGVMVGSRAALDAQGHPYQTGWASCSNRNCSNWDRLCDVGMWNATVTPTGDNSVL